MKRHYLVTLRDTVLINILNKSLKRLLLIVKKESNCLLDLILNYLIELYIRSNFELPNHQLLILSYINFCEIPNTRLYLILVQEIFRFTREEHSNKKIVSGGEFDLLVIYCIVCILVKVVVSYFVVDKCSLYYFCKFLTK